MPQDTLIPLGLCQCGCGRTTKLATETNARRGDRKGQPCRFVSGHNSRTLSLGMRGTRVHNSWRAMIARCSNPNHDAYPYYGGRGIKVCDKWLTFAGFYEDMGDPPEGASLDRVDTDGDYCPENCRWLARNRQSRNRRDTVVLTYRGESRPLAEWAELMGCRPAMLHSRIARGWPAERILDGLPLPDVDLETAQ